MDDLIQPEFYCYSCKLADAWDRAHPAREETKIASGDPAQTVEGRRRSDTETPRTRELTDAAGNAREETKG